MYIQIVRSVVGLHVENHLSHSLRTTISLLARPTDPTMSSDEESISGEEATSEEEEVEQQVATKKKRKSKKKVRRQGLPVHLLLPFAPSCT